MQVNENIQSIQCTVGLNKFVNKYIGKIFQQNQVIVGINSHKSVTLVNEYLFLHSKKTI